jgi:hypothetical protein
MKLLRPAFLALACAAGLAAADPALLSLIPKDPRMIAGVDLNRAKASPFGQRILAEIKEEDRNFQQLVESTGFDPRRDLREAILATDGKTGENTVILASGTFDPSKISAFLRAKGAAPSIYKGVELWADPKKANPDGSMAIVDSSLAIFGKDAAVRAAIDRRASSGSALSAELEKRIAEWSANDAWIITTVPFTELGVNKDGQNRVMPAGLSSDAIRAVGAGVRFGKDFLVSGEALTRSDKDAQALADVFRFVVSMIRLNSDKPGASEALKVADTLQLGINGSALRFSLTVPEESLDRMMQRKGPAAGRVRAAR